jgi:hypothetical protein
VTDMLGTELVSLSLSRHRSSGQHSLPWTHAWQIQLLLTCSSWSVDPKPLLQCQAQAR